MNMPGYNGKVIITNNTFTYTSTTNPIRAIQAITDTAFTTLTDTNATTNSTTTASVAADFGTLSQGGVIYGAFTSVRLASGSAICYF